MRRVAITGVGVISPLGVGKEEFWKHLTAGKSAVKLLDGMVSCDLYKDVEFESKTVAEADHFDVANFNLPEDVRDLDRFIQFGVAAAQMAKEDAKLENVDPERFGVSLSTAICGTRRMEEVFLQVTENATKEIDPSKVSNDLYLASMSNTPATIIAALYNAQGPNLTLSTGCIGGMDAVGYAFETIRQGDADVMIAGATEAPLTPVSTASFEIINALTSSRNDDPTRASRPFDSTRDGFVLAEGCGIMVLEEYEHAVNRGAKIYGEVLGFSNVSNAMHMTDLVADGEDLARAVVLALADAAIEPEQIDYVSAHGSSTPQNDRCETSAIKRTLGERAFQIPISSAKSMEGHPLSAASAMELVACLMSFERGMVHPTINYESPDPHCDLDYVSEGARKWDGEIILKTASGFSGLHSAMVLKKGPRG